MIQLNEKRPSEMAPEAPVRPERKPSRRAPLRVPRVPKSKGSGATSRRAKDVAVATPSIGLLHPLRGEGPRRKGVHIARHCYPFWREQLDELEDMIELWIGQSDEASQ